MLRPELEVADIFRDHGAAWRSANAGHVSLDQLKVMSAIERCRTAALGGHVERCENEKCGYTQIAYNSCRNRHCPKCQGAAAREWLAEREAELLPVPYFHVVFSLPAKIADIAYQNKAAIYDILFKASAETMITIAAYLAPLRNSKWVVYCKRPFAGPEQVLRYLARYTHRVAISNRRLLSLDDKGVTFKWKDYRLEGRERYQVMTLTTHEFIRRFLMHVLPAGFHRIRYYGLLASGKRADNIARARELLTLPIIPVDAIKAANTNADQPQTPEHRCPCCGGRMIIIERFERGATPRSHAYADGNGHDDALLLLRQFSERPAGNLSQMN